MPSIDSLLSAVLDQGGSQQGTQNPQQGPPTFSPPQPTQLPARESSAQPTQDSLLQAAQKAGEGVDKASAILDEQYGIIHRKRFEGVLGERLDAAARVAGYEDDIALQQEVREILIKAGWQSVHLLRKEFSSRSELFGQEVWEKLSKQEYTGLAGALYTLSTREGKSLPTLYRIDPHIQQQLGKGSRFRFETPCSFSDHDLPQNPRDPKGIKLCIEGSKRGTRISSIIEDSSRGLVVSYHPNGYEVKEVRQENGGLVFICKPLPEVQNSPFAGQKKSLSSIVSIPTKTMSAMAEGSGGALVKPALQKKKSRLFGNKAAYRGVPRTHASQYVQGDRVSHPAHGNGTVEAVYGAEHLPNEERMAIRFDRSPRVPRIHPISELTHIPSRFHTEDPSRESEEKDLSWLNTNLGGALVLPPKQGQKIPLRRSRTSLLKSSPFRERYLKSLEENSYET